MTQTNTDFLFQITPAATDRAYPPAGASDDAARFDDHLSQASTYSSDSSRNGGTSPRTETARYDRDDRSWSSGGSNPNGRSSSPPPSQPAPTNHDEPMDGVSQSKPAEAAPDRDDRETNESDDTTAAETAGVAQTAASAPKKTGSKSEPNANSGAIATAKAGVANKKAATEGGDRKPIGEADGTAKSGNSLPNSAPQHADEAAKSVADAIVNASATDEDTGESQAKASEGKGSKAAKNAASTAKSGKEASASGEGAADNDTSHAAAGTEETTAVGAQKVSGDGDAAAALSDAAKVKAKSDAEGSSDEDSRTSSKNDARGDVRDASVQSNKVDAAQLAGGIPSPTDTGANAPSKAKDNEHSAKPIAARGEPVAAAFARMARNNVSESGTSASGANDLPQVDPSRFIGRVAKAFQTAQDRGGTLQLRLSPPELGALRIELNVKDGVMSASLQTENANARRLLLDHLPALRDRLAEQNIRVDRFDVDVRQEGSGGQTDTRGSQQQQFQHQSDQPTPRRQPQLQSSRELAPAERIVASPIVTDTGLNLIV
jgi:flagellar hook-length control protein FliK